MSLTQAKAAYRESLEKMESCLQPEDRHLIRAVTDYVREIKSYQPKPTNYELQFEAASRRILELEHKLNVKEGQLKDERARTVEVSSQLSFFLNLLDCDSLDDDNFAQVMGQLNAWFGKSLQTWITLVPAEDVSKWHSAMKPCAAEMAVIQDALFQCMNDERERSQLCFRLIMEASRTRPDDVFAIPVLRTMKGATEMLWEHSDARGQLLFPWLQREKEGKRAHACSKGQATERA